MSIAVIQHEFNFAIQLIINIIHQLVEATRYFNAFILLLFYIFYKTTVTFFNEILKDEEEEKIKNHFHRIISI